MGTVLLFGGLTALGKPVIEQLVNDGEDVLAVRSMVKEQVFNEEEIEMFFGRNAFFRAVNNEWIEDGEGVESVICLDTTTFITPADFYVDADRVVKRISQCLNSCANLKDIIVLSHIDIYGELSGEINERTPVSPETEKGHHVDQVERALIETLLQNKEKARTIRAFICRIPNINITHQSKGNESLRLEDAAHGICSLLRTDFNPGIEVVQLTSGQEYKTPKGLVKYPFEKAKHLIDFSPNQNPQKK